MYAGEQGGTNALRLNWAVDQKHSSCSIQLCSGHRITQFILLVKSNVRFLFREIAAEATFCSNVYISFWVRKNRNHVQYQELW